MPRFEVELASSHGIKLEVSKREPVEQTVIDPILALFAPATATVGPSFLAAIAATASLHCAEQLPVV